MPLVTLTEVLAEAEAQNTYCLGFVCQGWEDSRAYVQAGEAANAPVILSAGPGARRNMPVALWGAMFRHLGDQANCPVVAHLDHGTSLEDAQAALDAGFTSVMFDGSALPLDQNIAITNQVTKAAKAYGASVEAEVGKVGYEGRTASQGTTPNEAQTFSAETDIDALAISVGNLHLQTKSHAVIDWARLAAIETVTDSPLVLHGGSGIRPNDRLRLASDHRVRKLNLGTELRQAFGTRLRQYLDDNPSAFDRTEIITAAVAGIEREAYELLRASRGSNNRA